MIAARFQGSQREGGILIVSGVLGATGGGSPPVIPVSAEATASGGQGSSG